MRSFKYMGKYDGIEEHLPNREHTYKATQFIEPKNPNRLRIIATFISIVILVPLIRIYSGNISGKIEALGVVLGFVAIFPHELLHGLILKGDVYMYIFDYGMCGVIGVEDISKLRFILLSLFPNIILGVVPFVIYYIYPEYSILGPFGAVCIAGGVGDYINVVNAIIQVPKGAKIYMSGLHTYWYLPNNVTK